MSRSISSKKQKVMYLNKIISISPASCERNKWASTELLVPVNNATWLTHYWGGLYADRIHDRCPSSPSQLSVAGGNLIQCFPPFPAFCALVPQDSSDFKLHSVTVPLNSLPELWKLEGPWHWASQQLKARRLPWVVRQWEKSHLDEGKRCRTHDKEPPYMTSEEQN